MTSPASVAEQRATVRHLDQSGTSHREIARRLDITRATVAATLAAPPTKSERLALKVVEAEAAVAQVYAAAQAIEAARPAYTFADDETARRWHETLRATVALLTSQAGAFADYYPFATVADDAPQRLG
ncbi:hypothetical protein [Streptomyces sp. NBC_01264]|uniref:hypothetical protein n=1 Tax=Streptomyces sp. NBC_01264 TaxID=2903804 RepID=UPI0022591003|nr:hypothetical protein [Streptomyces sp. NBC_01264]MCX4780076.1 hypothetical protein [Streptomyces sp. NBC_01264]